MSLLVLENDESSVINKIEKNSAGFNDISEICRVLSVNSITEKEEFNFLGRKNYGKFQATVKTMSHCINFYHYILRELKMSEFYPK